MTRSKFTLWLLACFILMVATSLAKEAEGITFISKDQFTRRAHEPGRYRSRRAATV